MYEFYPAPPTIKQRIGAGLMMAFLISAAVNYYADLHWFRGYDKEVCGAAALIGMFWVRRFAPQVRKK
jgi:hypothetical protein